MRSYTVLSNLDFFSAVMIHCNIHEAFMPARAKIMHLTPPPPPVSWAAVRSKAAFLCICYALLYVLSSFAIIFMGKRELLALLCLSGVL